MGEPTKALLVLACATALAVAADPTVNGEWLIQRAAAGNESQQTCTFEQKGNVLGGTCSSQNGPVALTGKIEGKKITWTIKSESQGGPVTIVYNGSVDSEDTMSGSVSAVEFGIDGQFSGKRSK